jgi:Ca-activated chloride channel homolog
MGMVEVSAMKFIAPYWLWGLAVLPLLYWFLALNEKRRQNQFALFAHQKIWSFIAPEMDLNSRIRKARVWLVAMGLAFIALARPQLGSHEEKVTVTGMDIMLALDISNSMETEDVVPSRLKRARHSIRTLASHLEGDRVGLVAFAASTYVACPLTTDLNYLLETIQLISPKMIPTQGTNIGLGLSTALKALERGGEESVGGKSSEGSSHAIILLSDGEDHEDEAFEVAEKIKESGIKFFVIGIGTEKGGPIPIRDDLGNSLGFKKDQKGQPVVSKFHSEFLSKLAAKGGGSYWNSTPDESEISELVEKLGLLNRSEYAERKFRVYEERFQIPLALALILLFLEVSLPVRKLLIALLFLSVPFIQRAQADNFIRNSAPLETYLENRKGIEAYQEGRIEEAEKSFGAAQARDPSRPELEFNQGIIQLEQGEVDRAIENFKSSAQLAQEKQNHLLFGKSLYNLGKAFTKKGDLKEAVESYLGAIQSAQRTQDQKLEDDSRKNLELLVDEVKKQQQQKKQEQEQQEQEQQQQQQQDQQGGNQDNQKSPPKNAKDQKGPEKRSVREVKQKKQKFQSKKMSSEDADRVMSELTARERELYERLQRQNGKPGNSSKDW